MKVLLINVPFSIEQKLDEQGVFGSIRNTLQPLGLAYLAAAAEGDGHEVKILDEIHIRGWQSIRDATVPFQPDVVGLSASTPAFPAAGKIARFIRELLPDSAIVLGGAHASALPAEAVSNGDFDYAVIGEGEVTFLELLGCLQGQGPKRPEDIDGIALPRPGGATVTPRRAMIKDLDALPMPARDLLPGLGEYHPTQASYRKLPLAHVMTSRGCPTKCKFCDRAIFGEKYRAHSADRVLAEVEQAAGRYGAREVRFFDDTFTLNQRRLGQICAGLARLRPKVSWTCLTKVTAVSLDMLRMMRAAGCWQVLYGLESGDDRILESLGKGNTVDQNRRAVSLAREAGLRVRADFLVGTPRETPESLEATLRLAKELPLDFAHFNKFTPFPGTEFYRELVDQGYELDLATFSDVHNCGGAVYVPPGLSEQDYLTFLTKAHREFYLRPRYLLRRLLGMRTFTEVRGHFQGFLAVRKM